jgi:hypothetical protein
MKNLFFICFSVVFFSANNGVFAQQQKAADPIELKVKVLLAKMTLDEKKFENFYYFRPRGGKKLSAWPFHSADQLPGLPRSPKNGKV